MIIFSVVKGNKEKGYFCVQNYSRWNEEAVSFDANSEMGYKGEIISNHTLPFRDFIPRIIL